MTCWYCGETDHADDPCPKRVRTEKPDSFGRALAEVWFLNGLGQWESVSEFMIRHGYAVPMTRKGGAK